MMHSCLERSSSCAKPDQYNIGVRSGIGMTAAELLSQTELTASTPIYRRDRLVAVAHSLRNVSEPTKIAEKQWTQELLPLLAEGPFRLVAQQGLVASEDYKAVTQCLRAQYAPEGNQLEWQAKFQRRVQKSGEQLAEYVGYLRR